jgi:hypothetical protein
VGRKKGSRERQQYATVVEEGNVEGRLKNQNERDQDEQTNALHA